MSFPPYAWLHQRQWKPAVGRRLHHKLRQTAHYQHTKDRERLPLQVQISPFVLRTVRYTVHLLVSQKSRLYHHPFGMPTALGRLPLLPDGIVVEPSPVQSLAADCPLHYPQIFLHSHSGIFHPHAVALQL